MVPAARGFTLVELLVTLGIVVIVLTLSVVGLSNLVPKQEADTTLQTLVSDITTQQTKAVAGDASSPDGHFGVHFAPTEYTLFAGTIFNPEEPNNFTIPLNDAQQFAQIDLPADSVVFQPVSGEVLNWDQTASSAALLSLPTNRQQVFSINRYGVIFTP